MSAWQTAELVDVCDIIMGQAPPGEAYNGDGVGHPLIAGAGDFDGTAPAPKKWTTVAPRLSKCNDIILGIRASIGEAVRADGAYCLGRGVAALRPRSKLDVNFVWHWLSQVRPELAHRARGATFKQITADDIATLPISFPDLIEQSRIAAILDEADALRAKRRAALAQLNDLVAALFFDRFGDPTRNGLKWPVLALGSILSDGPQNGLYRPASDYGDGVPILRIDSFYDGVVTKLHHLKRLRVTAAETKLYALRPNDIVVNRVNSIEYLGKSALIPQIAEPTVFESNMMRMTIDTARALPRFIVQLLQTAFIKDQIRQASKHAVNQSSINQKDVSGFRIICPPISEQAAFVTQIASIDLVRESMQQAIGGCDSLFTSLQHRAFRGEL